MSDVMEKYMCRRTGIHTPTDVTHTYIYNHAYTYTHSHTSSDFENKANGLKHSKIMKVN